MDQYGNKVQIVQRIAINGTMVNQFFFETICSNSLVFEEDDIFGTTYRRSEEAQTCKGIDQSVRYASSANSTTSLSSSSHVNKLPLTALIIQ